MSQKHAGNNQIELTAEGLAELEDELNQLVTVKLPAATERVAIAREHGDLSENAEYHSARDDKELIETRIDQIKSILENSVVVKATKSHQNIGVGSSVTLTKKGSTKKISYTLVGEYQADPVNGKISVASPLGKALLKKKVGDTVTVTAPNGKSEYTIQNIT
ncbi:transcription elongation factor GreA [Candidatus Woesebacteria bacterium]|nr:transcription elongation factor GreA [Candidatus Woesebacteria bacterium]